MCRTGRAHASPPSPSTIISGHARTSSARWHCPAALGAISASTARLLGARAAVLYAFATRRFFEGRGLAIAILVFGLGRFGFDFLRARDLPYVDARDLSLIPASSSAWSWSPTG